MTTTRRQECKLNLKKLLEQPEFRQVMSCFIDDAGTRTEEPPSGNVSVDNYKAGFRAFGVKLEQELIAANKTLYLKMLEEN